MVIEPGNGLNAQNTLANRAKQASVGKADASVTSEKSVSRPASSGDSVSLSATGRAIPKLEAKIAASSDVDIEKVSRIKNAIANGSYTIDAKAIAEKIQIEESQLG